MLRSRIRVPATSTSRYSIFHTRAAATSTATSFLLSSKRFASSSSSDKTAGYQDAAAEIQATIDAASSASEQSASAAASTTIANTNQQQQYYQNFIPPNNTGGATEQIAGDAAANQFIHMSSTAASQEAVATTTAASSKPALVSMVDSIFNGVSSVFSYITPDFNPILDFGMNTVIAAQVATGLPWSTVFFLTGVCVRLSTLYFTMYGERASLRMQVALPELKKAYHRFEIVYYDPASTEKEIHQVSTRLQEEQKKAYAKHGTSNIKALASFVSGPIFVYGFWVAMRTAGLAPGVSASSFAWIPCLTAPDPYSILPVAVVGITVLNFELFFLKKGGTKGTGLSSNIINGIRLAALSSMWAISHFRASVLLYWAGVSITGLLQPLLMRNKHFQKLWGVPTDDDMKRAITQASEAAMKAAEATVGGKSPSQIFVEKLKETTKGAVGSTGGGVKRASFGSSATSSSSTDSTTTRTAHEEQELSEAEAKSNMKKKDSSTASSPGAVPSFASFLSSAANNAANKQQADAAKKQQHGGGLAYRVLKASELEERQQKDAANAEQDPMMQRFMMSMPMVSQTIVNPEKNQKLAEDIQNFNENQMEEARKTRSWKSKTK